MTLLSPAGLPSFRARLDAAGRARLAGFAVPEGLSKGQRALARRLAALVSPAG